MLTRGSMLNISHSSFVYSIQLSFLLFLTPHIDILQYISTVYYYYYQTKLTFKELNLDLCKFAFYMT